MNVLKHRFTSAKSDGADATQVQPSHWNDGHGFTGGAAGDVLTRDPTDATYGATWGGNVSIVSFTGDAWPYLPVGHAATVVVQCTNTADATLFGVVPASTTRVGTRLIIQCMSTGRIALPFNSQSVPTGATLWNFLLSGPTPIAAGQLLDGSHPGGIGGSATYVFDGARWRMGTHEQGRPLKVAYNAANYVGATVPAGNVVQHDYYVAGSRAQCRAYLTGVTVPTPVAAIVVKGWPFTFAVGSSVLLPSATSVGGYGFCFARPTADFTGIRLETTNFQPWAAGVVDVMFDVTMPIL